MIRNAQRKHEWTLGRQWRTCFLFPTLNYGIIHVGDPHCVRKRLPVEITGNFARRDVAQVPRGIDGSEFNVTKPVMRVNGHSSVTASSASEEPL